MAHVEDHRAPPLAEQALERFGHLQRRLAVQPAIKAHDGRGAVTSGRDVHGGRIIPVPRPRFNATMQLPLI